MADVVKLNNLLDFQEALAGYEVSKHAKSILESTQLVILLGVFGAGRNSIINELCKSEKYYYIVSDTTRPPKVRDGVLELHGVHYYFRDESEMLRDIKKGEFLEAEVIHSQQVSGISIRELEKARNSGKVPITEVDLQGTVNILKTKPDTLMIFVVPPSYDEWIRRITAREEMSEQEFANRMATAQKILSSVLSSDAYKFVINDTLQKTASRVNELVKGGKHSEEHHQEAKNIATELLKAVNIKLGNK